MSLLNLTSDIYFFSWFNHFCRVYTDMYSDVSCISLKFRPMHAMPVFSSFFFFRVQERCSLYTFGDYHLADIAQASHNLIM